MKNKNEKQDAPAQAEKPVQRIELESNVGKAKISLSFTSLIESELPVIGKLFAGYHLWHKGQSLMFAGGKKAKFTSKSPYSPELQAHTLAILNAEFGKFCSDFQCEVSEYVEESDESKFYKACKAIGMSEQAMKAAWTTAQEQKAAPAESPAEQTAENTLE